MDIASHGFESHLGERPWRSKDGWTTDLQEVVRLIYSGGDLGLGQVGLEPDRLAFVRGVR